MALRDDEVGGGVAALLSHADTDIPQATWGEGGGGNAKVEM
jgi:hypothetical protein